MPQSIHCRNCGAPLDPRQQRCAYCGAWQGFESTQPWNLLFQSRKTRVRFIYPLLIAAGLLVAVFIFGLAFDRLSETTLVRLTPIWFFLIVFGIYGYVAEKLLASVYSGESASVPAALGKWLKQTISQHPLFGLLAALLLFPFLLTKARSSLLAALLGSLVWGVLLLIFFEFVFPAL